MTADAVKPRDLFAMAVDGACVVCGHRFGPGEPGGWLDFPAHVAAHLADGSAVVVKEFGRVDRVVPSNTFPEERPTAGDAAAVLHGRLRVVRGRSFRP